MIFNKNITILKSKDKALARQISSVMIGEDLSVIDARSGDKTVKAAGVALHSMYDPEKEAAQWADHNYEKIENMPAIILLGFGFGYHIRELLRKTDADLFVYEPRLDIIKAAMQSVDLTDVLNRVRIITDLQLPVLRKNFEIIEHGPSININRAYYIQILNRLKTLKLIANGLKVMVVGPIYGGSLPIARYCADALRNIGAEVDFFDSSIFNSSFFSVKDITTMTDHQNQLRDMLASFISEAVIARCQEYRPDIVFALAQAPLNELGLTKLRASGIPTAFWFVEDYKTLSYWNVMAKYYDYFFTIQQGDFIRQLKELGLEKVKYLPLAASPHIHKKVKLTKKEREMYGSDVSFMGAGYYNRRKFFLGLMDHDLKIWGNEWDPNAPLNRFYQKSGERIDTEETVKIFNASKVNVNLHSSTYHAGVDPYGDFVNPRTFEIAACGAFQLVDHRTELPELFRLGEEIVCFEDISDIRRKINYYLKNDDLREAAAEKAMKRVLKDHTYEQRMYEALQFMVDSGLNLPSWSNAPENLRDLIARAGDDTELGIYLKKFRSQGNISLSDIMSSIRKGKGELDSVEKMFLLLDELREVYCKRN
ncbi:MAG: glycosyltransferase [Dissulfurispiraceae bacterium]|jgi:spore maturation protein CgeB|nr:glycosyltransferase [Dissulfurispiraceae bacterium]